MEALWKPVGRKQVTDLKNDCASPAVTIVGSGAGSFKMEASSGEKNSPSLK